MLCAVVQSHAVVQSLAVVQLHVTAKRRLTHDALRKQVVSDLLEPTRTNLKVCHLATEGVLPVGFVAVAKASFHAINHPNTLAFFLF